MPSEQTCFEDARSAWDFIIGTLGRICSGKQPKEMVGVLGHSLGGCIAADLVAKLAKEGESSSILELALISFEKVSRPGALPLMARQRQFRTCMLSELSARESSAKHRSLKFPQHAVARICKLRANASYSRTGRCGYTTTTTYRQTGRMKSTMYERWALDERICVGQDAMFR